MPFDSYFVQIEASLGRRTKTEMYSLLVGA